MSMWSCSRASLKGAIIAPTILVFLHQTGDEEPMSTFSSIASPGSRELIVGGGTSGRLLQPREAAWLNADHARVREMSSPGLDADHSLAEAMRPNTSIQ